MCVTTAAPSAAATSSFDVGDQAIVFVQARGARNEVTVRSWDRSTVQIESADDTPQVDRNVTVLGALPVVVPVPPMAWLQHDAGGLVTGGGMMPPEDFPYTSFRPGAHDTIRITAQPGAHLTVTVPATTGILQVRVGAGVTSIDGYHGGNLFVVQNAGRVQLSNTSTTAFAQMGNGVLYAADDTFDRIRVRANAAHIVFEHCRSKQIETSTVSGSIVYDGGTFDPGLARFESQTGNVALGVASPAQLTGRTQDGRVYTQFVRRAAAIDSRDDGDTTATIGGGGGALVNAISERGNVFLYDGTLATHRATPVEWRPVRRMFTAARHARPPQSSATPRRPSAAAHARAGSNQRALRRPKDDAAANEPRARTYAAARRRA
ncbi:MAG: hypothetical protein ABI186_08695 [Candidatus Elarobacter sp.]